MKLINIITLVVYVSFSTVAQAEMSQIKKGDPAPFDGILVDKSGMQQFRQIDEERKLFEQQNVKLKDLAVINDQRIDLYKQEVKMVRDDLSSSQRKAFWTNIGYFALGVIVTGLASKVAIESTR